MILVERWFHLPDSQLNLTCRGKRTKVRTEIISASIMSPVETGTVVSFCAPTC